MSAKYPDCIGDITSKDILDSRDLEELLGRLESEESRSEREEELFTCLKELRAECESSGWPHGIAFIRDTHWDDYCRDFASDVGYLPNTNDNPLLNCIDWEEWAAVMAEDYQTTEIDTTSYYWREA